MNKKNLAITSIIGVTLFCGGYLYGKEVGRTLPMTSKSYSTNKVIATVGDVDIKEKEIKDRMEVLFYINRKDEMSDDEIFAYESSFMDYITTTEMLSLEAKSEGIEINDEDLNLEYEILMSSIEQTFNITEDNILKDIKISKTDILNSLEKEMLSTIYIGEASDVSEDEASEYYKANKEEFFIVQASHILISNECEDGEHTCSESGELTEEEQQERLDKANDILKQANAGVDFSYLASEYSDDISGAYGGDLGYFSEGQMVMEFEDAVFNMEVGDISDIVETDFGYHIIKKTDETYHEFDTVKEDLIYTLSYEKQSKLLNDLSQKYGV